MAKDTYTYKEILLGLRNEFIDVERKLRELKDYTIKDDKYISKYYYHISKYSEHHLPELRVHIERKQSELMRILRDLARKYSYYYNPASSLMVKDNNGTYYPLKGKPFVLAVLPQDKKQFEQVAEEILNSQFASEINFNGIHSTEPNPHQIITTHWYQPRLKLLNKDFNTAYFDYLGRTDQMRYSGSNALPLTQSFFDEIMNIEFPKEAFSEYYQDIIENNPDRQKSIILPEDYPTTYEEYRIIDYGHDNKILLKAIKNKNKSKS